MPKFTYTLPADLWAEAQALEAADRAATAEAESRAATLRESFSAPAQSDAEILDHVRFSKRYSPWERAAAAKRIRELRRSDSSGLTSAEVDSDSSSVSVAKHDVALDLRDASRRHVLGADLGITLSATEGERDCLRSAAEAVGAEVLVDAARAELRKTHELHAEAARTFQAEKTERSVSRASEDLGVLFVHALPVPGGDERFTEALNHAVSSGDTFDRARIVIGLRPAIATSTISVAENHGETMYPFGLVLGEGRVLAAYPHDAATFADESGRRRSRGDASLGGSVIQPKAGDRLREAVESKDYNEIVVESPTVSGIFIDLDRRESSLLALQAGTDVESPDLEKIKKYVCEKIGIPPVPIFARRGGRVEKMGSSGDLPSLNPTPEMRQTMLEKIIGVRR